MPKKVPGRQENHKGKKRASLKRHSKADRNISAKKTSSKTSNIPKVQNEANLLFALEAGNIGLWQWNLLDNSVEWSVNASLIFGIDPDEFDGTFETYYNLILQDDRSYVLKTIQSAIKSKSKYQIEHRIKLPNESVRWIEIAAKVSLNKKGEAEKLIGTLQDINKRKSLEFEGIEWRTKHELISTAAGLVIYDYNIITGDIQWSGDCLEVLGYNKKELGNIDRWIELIHKEDRKEAFNKLEKAQSKLDPYDVTYRFRKKKGDYVFMHDRGLFIADQQGRAVRMLGMMNDVSELVKAQLTIRENHRFLEGVENAMPGVLYVFDVVTKSNIYTNKTCHYFLGYSPHELKALGPEFAKTIIHPDDQNKLTEWDAEPNGTVKETEIRMRTKNGNYRWFATRDTPFLRDANGKVIQVVGIAEDVTSRKETLQQLNTTEASYHELFDTVADAIYLLSEEGEFIEVNQAASLMYGYPKNDFKGKTLRFLSAEDKNDFNEIDKAIGKALKGEPQTFEFWGQRKSGITFLQELQVTRGKQFGVNILIATGRDITERSIAEEALKESEQRFRTLQSASFGGIGLHYQGVIIDCNQGLCDVTGYTYAELVGFNGLLLIAPEWRDFVMDKIKSGYEQTYDVEGLKKSGERYFLEIQGKNIPYKGKIIRVTEFRDITGRKKAEEKILEQNARLLAVTDDLKRKNEQLEEFTQIVSHNLRSPVGNIVALTSLYESAATDEERAEFFNLLKESGNTTLMMLNDINEVLKIKQDKNIEKQQLKFQSVLEQVIAMLNAKITQREATITHNFSQAPEILFPSIYLESIILNLVDNALKYSDPKRNPVINLKTYFNEQGNLILEVNDNGLGINMKRYGHHVFKLRKTFHKHPESRGIGLFMIKNQIEAMGGEINIESVEHEGTTFYINFNKNQID